MHPKVLIVMTMSYSTSESSRTLDAYFHFWEHDRVSQIFTKNWVPRKGHCGELFQITDEMILDKWLMRKGQDGIVYRYDDLGPQDGNHTIQSGGTASIGYKVGVSHTPIVELLRGLLWREKFWHTSRLDNWLDEFKPDCILYNFSNHIFTQQIALYVARRFDIPIIMVIGDDYYFNDHQSFSPAYHLFRRKFKRLTEQVVSYSSGAAYCSEKIKDKYSSHFGLDGNAIYISSTLHRRPFRPINAKNPSVVYAGSVRLGRDAALCELANGLGRIDESYRLTVYSNEPDPAYRHKLMSNLFVEFGGQIPYDEVRRVISEADIFVIAEGFDEENLLFTRYSLSTKAADALASGVSIFTYGPADSGVVGYMEETDASVICTNPSDVEDSLRRLIDDVDLQERLYTKAEEVTLRNHTIESSCSSFEDLIQKSVCAKTPRNVGDVR